MNRSGYNAVQRAWDALRRRKSDRTGTSGGTHYLLVWALMQVGIECRGLSNDEIEGEAESFLQKHVGRFR